MQPETGPLRRDCSSRHSSAPYWRPRQERLLRCILLTTACLLAVIFSIVPRCVGADETKAETQTAEPENRETGIHITPELVLTIDRMQLSSYPVANDRTLCNLSLHVVLQNDGQQPFVFQRRQLTLHADGRNAPPRINLGNLSAFLPDGAIPAGQSVAGIVEFSGIDTANGEPRLELLIQLAPDQAGITVSVNDILRQLTACSVNRLGPQDRIAILRINRDLDSISMWVLHPLLQRLSQTGARQIVIAAAADRLTVHEEVLSWLAHAVGDANLAVQKNNAAPQLPADSFEMLMLGGFGRRPGMRYREPETTGIRLLATAEAAVTELLIPYFEQMSVDEAFLQFQHPDAGVRHAAVRTTVDRLRPDQRQQLRLSYANYPGDVRIEIIRQLFTNADQATIELLGQECLNDSDAIAGAAMYSLARCGLPTTLGEVERVWMQIEANPHRQRQFVSVLLDSRDDRWANLLTTWAVSTIRLLAEKTTSHPDSDDATPDATPSVHNESTDGRRADGLAVQIRRVARVAESQGDSRITDQASASLMQIPHSDLQDVLAEILKMYKSGTEREILIEYAASRIEAGRVTSNVIDIMREWPDPRWPEYVLNGIEGNQRDTVSRVFESQLMDVLIRSMNAEQRDRVIECFDVLTSEQQVALLEYLSMTQHPRRLELIETRLESNRTHYHQLYNLLAQEGSEEALQMLCDRMILLVSSSDPDDFHSRQREIDTLVGQLEQFRHPECLRALNICARRTSGETQTRAQNAIFQMMAKSPALDFIRRMIRARQKDQSDLVIRSAEAAMLTDPFLYAPYLYRASELMRKGELDAAMSDLNKANQFNPESLPVISTIALLRVRQGDVEAGLVEADRILQLAPRDESNLYNAACTYARAAEQADAQAEERTVRLNRCLELLRLAVDAGFHDLEHIQDDYDLTILRNDARFDELLKEIAELDRKAGDARPDAEP
ncbi:MAG: hypothetical protein KDA85_07740 [Planctomycetaceae bacterium]|nr:hypothetical protein [Planctomycetaceae bacterium]